MNVHACLEALRLYIAPAHLPAPAEARYIDLISLARECLQTAFRPGALRNRKQAEQSSFLNALSYFGNDAFKFKWNLRDQDDICPTGDAGMQGDEPGLAAH